GKCPYVEIGHPPKLKTSVEALNFEVPEFASNVKNRGNIPGFLRSYLEKKAWEFSTSRDMKTFITCEPSLFMGKVNKKRSDWKRKADTVKETYRQWVKERVQEVKLPFIVKAPIPRRSPEPIPISIEEADELKSTNAQLNKEKEEL
ncbi:hypothetical protein L195_g028148, partial [Trifolium pratense]